MRDPGHIAPEHKVGCKRTSGHKSDKKQQMSLSAALGPFEPQPPSSME